MKIAPTLARNSWKTEIKLFLQCAISHESRASLKYSMSDCRLFNMLINIIKYHCLSNSKCGACLCSLDIFCFVELCLCALYSNAIVEHFSNYLKIVKTEWRCRLDEWNIKFLLRIKVEGPKLKGFAKKMCANTDTLWWDSKE